MSDNLQKLLDALTQEAEKKEERYRLLRTWIASYEQNLVKALGTNIHYLQTKIGKELDEGE